MSFNKFQKLRKKGFCPVCEYLTFDPKPNEEHPGGTYDICPICHWEDDGVQLSDPEYSGGANRPSLKDARENFQELGACEERATERVLDKEERSKYERADW